jgi:membrane protein required for colicin V production
MNYIDIILLIPLVFGIFKGYSRGFILGFTSFAGLVLGLYLSARFSTVVQQYLKTTWEIEQPLVLPFLAFILIFFGIIIVFYFIGRSLEGVLKIAALNIFNKIAGAFFGVFKWLLILSFFAFLLNKFNEKTELIEQEKLDSSFLYNPISAILPSFIPMLDELKWFKKQVDTTTDELIEEVEI